MFDVVHFSGTLLHLLINFAKVGDLNSHLLDLNSADLASNVNNPTRMPYPVSPRMKDATIKLIRVGLSITKMNDKSAKLEVENQDEAWAGVVDNFLAIKLNSADFSRFKYSRNY